jgi:NADPH:quinone reductase-like Zn-dependent oxidoreductase
MLAENDVLAVEFDGYGGPEVLKLRRISPPQPVPGEVLIKVHAASMSSPRAAISKHR